MLQMFKLQFQCPSFTTRPTITITIISNSIILLLLLSKCDRMLQILTVCYLPE